eukprot:1159343-Pelagomonas_calceolata.AAC.7
MEYLWLPCLDVRMFKALDNILNIGNAVAQLLLHYYRRWLSGCYMSAVAIPQLWSSNFNSDSSALCLRCKYFYTQQHEVDFVRCSVVGLRCASMSISVHRCISASGMQALQQNCPGLQALSFAYVPLSREAVHAVASMSRLRRLQLLLTSDEQ